MKLSRDVFLALAAIAWADGEVHPSEAAALADAARASELAPDDLAALEAALADRSRVPPLGELGLTRDEKLYVYAIAAWLVRVDGKVTSEEVDALGDLGDRLGLTPRDRARAEVASHSIARFDEASGAPAHDVARLASELRRAADDRRA